MGVKYRTIVADPPWPFQWGGGKGGRRRRETELGYPTMTFPEIAALAVAEQAEDDAHLYLWVTAEFNREGHGVATARAWGFQPVGEIIWAKPNFGMGLFPRPQHEILLVCRRGRLPFALNNVGSVHHWKRHYEIQHGFAGKRHSTKPDGAQDLIEQASPGPYLELFARRQRLGWDTWGNQCFNHVELTA